MMNKTQQNFAFCTIPKNGCSRWRRFLRKVQGVRKYLGYPHNYAKNGLKYSSDFDYNVLGRAGERLPFQTISTPTNGTSQTDSSIPTLPTVPRIALIRDPHARLLSAWSNKIKEEHHNVASMVAQHTKESQIRKTVASSCHDQQMLQGNFTHFVTCLEESKENLSNVAGADTGAAILCRYWDGHIAPQICNCRFQELYYDLMLPVEDIDRWFQPLVVVLD